MSIPLAFCGLPGLGGTVMRGVSVAKRLGVPFFDVRKAIPKCQTLVLVKYPHGNATNVRNACDRFVWDSLDSFSKWKSFENSPPLFWQWTRELLGYDEIIGTSPACVDSMRLGLDCPVHLLPHHADERCSEDWGSERGHIAYAGGRQYIESGLQSIEDACRKAGRRFVPDFSRSPLGALQDAALHLHLRLPPHDTKINRVARPQVKAENAAACGAKMLASNHPCVTSLRPEVPVIGDDETLIDAIMRSLESPPLRNPQTLESSCQSLLRILSGNVPPTN